jgi:hypothetical protein
MKFCNTRMPAGAFFAALLAAFSCSAQSTNAPSSPAAQSKPKPQTTQPANKPDTQPSGQVIFERSIDENGNATTKSSPAAGKVGAQMAAEPSVEDVDRQAITFTNLDLDVRLQTASQHIVVRALVTIRNTGKTPLPRVPLQISSSLNWERIRVAGRDVSFPVATLNSDADHTGRLHEAAVPLAEPLAPGAAQQLDVTYSGTIAASAQRLIALGTPEDAALHSDWDQISPNFTGLRGFGNVVWYPVSSVPVILGDGARLFDEIGTQKLCLSGAAFRLRLTVEFLHGLPPTVAVVNGIPLALQTSDPPSLDADVAGIATGATESSTLAFESPSLFVAARTPYTGTHLTAFGTPDHQVAVKAWLAAAAQILPFVERWLGPQPRNQLTLLDLPDSEDVPWEAGPMLAVSLRESPPEQLTGVLAHALTHAYLGSQPVPKPFWLTEGVANFMGTVWTERQQGRDRAVASLEEGRMALALAEPGSPGQGAGQPLATAISPVYYRTKATYVLMMLRDMIGDDALGAALRDYNASQSAAASGSTDAAGTRAFEQALKKAAPSADFSWLFSDWIDADKGLPDLVVDKVFPSAVQSGNWLVSVNVSNAGYAAAEVPVIVRSTDHTTAERVLVPGRGSVVKRLLIQGKPIEVQVNDGIVPETQASVHVVKLDQPVNAQHAATGGDRGGRE